MSLDLRLKYKLETGCSPTLGKFFINNSTGEMACNYKGDLTDEYAQWLEEHFLADEIRKEYKNSTGKNGVYFNIAKKLSEKYTPNYTKDYKSWLEHKIEKKYEFNK